MDERLFHLLFSHGDRPALLTEVMRALTALGSGWCGLAILPFLFFARFRRGAAALTVAVLVQAWGVFVLKRLVGRTRPWITLQLHVPFSLPHDSSFPSGHATASFTVAAFLASIAIASQIPARHAIALAVLSLAGGIAVSRVYLGAHWPTDVLTGAMLGTVLGCIAARFALRAPRVRGARASARL